MWELGIDILWTGAYTTHDGAQRVLIALGEALGLSAPSRGDRMEKRSLYLSAPALKQLKQVAKIKDVPYSELVRIAIEEWLTRNYTAAVNDERMRAPVEQPR